MNQKVKPGYKQTEVGVIPEEWEVKPISHIVERLEAGVSVNSVDENLTSCAHSESVLKTSAVSEGCFLPHECKKIAPRDLSRVSLRPRANTIIISRMNTPALVGECGYVDKNHENLFLPDRLWMTKQRSGSEESIRWLAYLLSSKPQKDRIKELATGTSGSMKNLAKSSLLELEIAVPTPSAQHAIATALSDVDALLAALDRLIAKQRDLKQAAMQQLLTGQTRLPGFTGKWETKTLKQAAEINTGINKPVSEMGQGALYVTVQDLYDGASIRIERLGRIRVSPAEIEARALIAGDIIFGKSSVKREGIGYPSQFLGCAEPVVFSGFTYRARAREGIADAIYLYYALRSSPTRRWLIDNSQASALTNINQRIADAIPVTLPPLPEQTAIATVLSDMDLELAALEQRRDKTRALKQGMMQELLTGRTRLA